jgi:hypothetical protein
LIIWWPDYVGNVNFGKPSQTERVHADLEDCEFLDNCEHQLYTDPVLDKKQGIYEADVCLVLFSGLGIRKQKAQRLHWIILVTHRHAEEAAPPGPRAYY